jgi:lysophospholipase L1-like esterase
MLMRAMKIVIYNCVAIILLLAACEGVATAIKMRYDSGQQKYADRQSAQANSDVDQASYAQFLKEFAAAYRLNWKSYVYWRREPVAGQYVNVDADGIRRTWNPPDSGAPRIRIFMFGGSTMWGTGSRDDYTIPSELSKALSKSFGSGIQVVNLGESGYVQTQELITLLKEIQRGNIPQIAVFYDGFNDVFSAYQNNGPGLPQNEDNRVREFNILQSGPRLLSEWIRQLNLFWTVNYVAQRIGLKHSLPGPKPGPQTGNHRSLTTGLLTVYESNMRVIQAVSAEYGIRTVFFWQPTAFTRTNLTPEERASVEADVAFSRFYKTAMEELKNSGIAKNSSFRNLSDAFNGESGRIYIDTMHVSERGNKIIANLISASITDTVTQLVQGTHGPGEIRSSRAAAAH